ncbi:calcium-binding protein P-like isoform X1 [Scylla paramamosain]|uniref:calcium-binding protein P-like isoform X1 n=1 Tax=Scylla paramamosain TaxID=85552 RepID=UPI003083E281
MEVDSSDNEGGYQPAPQTTVVVVPVANRMRMRGPAYLQQGVKVGGMMLGMGCVACLAMFGGFFLFVGIIMISTANYDSDFWDNFDRDHDPTITVGTIMLVIGSIMVLASVGVCFYARKKYKKFGGATNPGQVINPPPTGYTAQPQHADSGYPQPAGYPGQPQLAGYPGQPQPAGYPGQPQPAGYLGQLQPAGYSGQPQPAGYPSQPQPYANPAPTGYPPYPEPTTSYPGPPAQYAAQPGAPLAKVDPSYPTKPQQSSMAYEYTPPPPHVPGSTDEPTAPPPYQP